MRITILGANGKVGNLLVAEALHRGHTVRAFAHSQPRIPAASGLSFVRGDVHDPRAVAKAVSGAEAVLSTLGSWGTPSKDILTTGMEAIIPAMQAQGIRRIITLTGADCRAPGDDSSLVHLLSHAAIAIVGSRVLRDAETHIELLQSSNLDWTVVRSPVMTSRGAAEAYTMSPKRPMPWKTINRKSVALAMLDELERPQHVREAPFIIRSNS